MKINVILPHTQLYGGVKRFLELGNIFIGKGHDFNVFTEEGLYPDWFNFKGTVDKIDQLSAADVIFYTDPNYTELVKKADAKRKIFYFVKGHEDLSEMKKANIEIFANSTNMYKEAKKRFGIEAFKAYGGINLNLYDSPKPFEQRDSSQPFTIIAYGRLNKRNKGTKYVVKACEMVYKTNKNIKLLLFDSPQDEAMKLAIKNFTASVPFEFILNQPIEKNHEMFKRADLFVSAERKAGWANTAVEALASGVPVVATKAGTRDFLFHKVTGLVTYRNSFLIAQAIRKMIKNEVLRLKLAKAGCEEIKQFNWNKLASNIETHLTS